MSDRYYPEGHKTSNVFCVFSRLRATPCPALAAAAKGKNVKMLKCKSGHRPANTEPEVVARVSGHAEVAIRYPRARRIAAPATATIHPIGTSCTVVWIRLCRAGITSIPVAAPLPYVSRHIIDPELVRRLLPDFLCLTPRV